VTVRIAQVAPLWESVPPTAYGGTERVVHWLTEELVQRGHEVTLFASGDSVTAARLVPVAPRALWHDPDIEDPWAWVIRELGMVFEQADQFDIIHSHVDYFAFPFARLVKTPVVHTLHGRLDIRDLPAVYRRYRDQAFVSISNSQRAPLPFVNWVATVYHGLDLSEYPYGPEPEDFLVFVGRISPEKGLHWAVEIAKRSGRRLVIAAKLNTKHPPDVEYFEKYIRPELGHPLVEFVGEVNQEEKVELLGRAYAFLFPIDWPEPFGLAPIEALACGCPVIARRRGSVPELMRDGVTGYTGETLDELAAAVRLVDKIDRAGCRRYVAERFSVQRMADDYERIYTRLILGSASGAEAGTPTREAPVLRFGS
jgi:glycosyltransferase involved in cell wall biosynthesis